MPTRRPTLALEPFKGDSVCIVLRRTCHTSMESATSCLCLRGALAFTTKKALGAIHVCFGPTAVMFRESQH
eukprot:6187710-Amphidinium_carterae.1